MRAVFVLVLLIMFGDIYASKYSAFYSTNALSSRISSILTSQCHFRKNDTRYQCHSHIYLSLSFTYTCPYLQVFCLETETSETALDLSFLLAPSFRPSYCPPHKCQPSEPLALRPPTLLCHHPANAPPRMLISRLPRRERQSLSFAESF